MDKPLISVITINYNNRSGLERTIKSVINQVSTDFEYLVIDGHSEDGSVDIICEYADQVDFWLSESDTGIYNAMNKGVANAHGKYVLFLNSGDMFYNNLVLKMVHDKLIGINADYVVGDIVIKYRHHFDRIVRSPRKVTADLIILDALSHPASFIKRDRLLACPYDEKLKIVADWKQSFQDIIENNATYEKLDIIIAKFEPGGVSSTNRALVEKERKRVYEELFTPIMAEFFIELRQSQAIIIKKEDSIFFFKFVKVYKRIRRRISTFF